MGANNVAKHSLAAAWLAALAVAIGLFAALCACAGSAYAATVHGADFHGSGSTLESGEVDVLNVDGEAGETVFLTVKGKGQTLAKNLPYTIGNDASANDGFEYAGVATLDIEGLDLNALDGSYTVEAYGDRASRELLYSGALYGVYADLPDRTSKLIGTRTANSSELAARAFQPAETLYSGGKTYRLIGQASSSESGALHFTYEAYDESTTVDGVVKYVDSSGNTVASTKIPGLAYGESRSIGIPSVISADNGDLYRTVFFQDSVTATNPGKTSFSVYCTKMSEATQALAGFYVATIQMVDEAGHVIATDSVNVTGDFIYTAPSTIYKTETINQTTGETAVVTYQLSQSPVIRLSAANDGVQNRARTITVSYAAQPLDPAEVTVTFNLIDGSKRVNEKGRVLGTEQVVVDDANPHAEPSSYVEVNGTMYYLVGEPGDYSYVQHSGAVPSIDAYYVPEGYQAPGAYDVEVNYVNFLTGDVVESHSYVSDSGANARIMIDSPETFSAGGVDYVRLAGQEAAIAHSFYSGVATYTVYYRDVNDNLSSNVVINTIRVVYQDGGAGQVGTGAAGTSEGAGSTEGASGAAGAEGAAGAAGAAGAEGAATEGSGAQALQLNGARTYNVMDGAGGNGTLTNESGVDSNTERIEDNETPLASGFDKGASSSAASSLSQTSQWLLPVGIGLAVLAVVIIAVVVIRRRKEDDELYEM